MSAALKISDVGLRLIKAYEGFRPVDVELVSGQRVAGYGHRVMNGENIHLSEKQAEKLLLRDLAPFEAMINDSIFAPLTQSQFDALCSLAYNIGPKKFLESDVVRALNNGRVLDAANGFDVWRKGQINGETYVVDALVRRRTAEKVLFLRPSLRAVRAPRVDLHAMADGALEGQTTSAPSRVLEDSGFVTALNFDASKDNEDKVDLIETRADDTLAENLIVDRDISADRDEIDDMFVERRNPDNDVPLRETPMRRRDDRPGGVLTLSEVFDDDYEEDEYSDASDPLIKDLDGFDLDIDSVKTPANPDEDLLVLDDIDGPLDIDDIVEYDDTALSIETDFNQNIEARLDDQDIDPSEYIVSDFAIAAQNNEEALTQPDDMPSPIATAAAEVSGRLDALMAEEDTNLPEQDKKILPFRSKKPAGILTNDKVKNRQDSSIYGSLLPAPTPSAPGAEVIIEETVEQEQSADVLAQKDSASRYIASTIAPAKSGKANSGLMLMVAVGMALLGGSIGAILSGVDERFGLGGEFLTTVGVLLGLMITLGSVYYVVKNSRET